MSKHLYPNGRVLHERTYYWQYEVPLFYVCGIMWVIRQKMKHRRLVLLWLQLHRHPLELDHRTPWFHRDQCPISRQIQLFENRLQALSQPHQETMCSSIILNITSKAGSYSAFSITKQTSSTSRNQKFVSAMAITPGKPTTSNNKPLHPKGFFMWKRSSKNVSA